MPRPIWSGAISFGLVTVPAKLFPAVHHHDVRFHQINRDTGNRVLVAALQDTDPDRAS